MHDQTTRQGIITADLMPTTEHPYCRTCCTTEHAAGPCPMARQEDAIIQSAYALAETVHDAAPDLYPEARTLASRIHERLTLGAVIAAALFLSITHTPAGCTITGHTSEGFPVATCADGSRIYADMDGAGGYNSGLPYVIPGTWVEMQ